VFQQSVLKWQREYLENKLTLTPSNLVLQADQECQILTHAGQWVETIDPSIVAMQGLIHQNKTKSNDIFQALAANFSQITQRQKDLVSSFRPSHWSNHSNQTPEWLLDAPTDPEQIKYFNGRYCHFCTKCGKNGRWVCTHTDATHDDRSRSFSPSHSYHRTPTPETTEYYNRSHRSPNRHYREDRHQSRGRWDSRSRSRSPHTSGYSSANGPPICHVAWNLPHPPTPIAKLSLLDSLCDFLDD
jgi:hypothetical protein